MGREWSKAEKETSAYAPLVSDFIFSIAIFFVVIENSSNNVWIHFGSKRDAKIL